MTVQELIDKLSALPGDMLVIRPGYEGGVAEVTELTPKKIKLHVNPEWYYGPHEIVPYRTVGGRRLGQDQLIQDWDIEAVYIG